MIALSLGTEVSGDDVLVDPALDLAEDARFGVGSALVSCSYADAGSRSTGAAELEPLVEPLPLPE